MLDDIGGARLPGEAKSVTLGDGQLQVVATFGARVERGRSIP